MLKTFFEDRYYLHQFSAQQPDLNYRNPNVVEAMKSVLKYYMDRGVAGFRLDAVSLTLNFAYQTEHLFSD